MRQAIYLSSFITALSISGLTTAQNIEYSFAELRYVDSEIGALDGDGLAVAGSLQFDPEWLVQVSYLDQQFPGDQDREQLEIGVGYLLPTVNGFDLSVAASYIGMKFGDEDDTGLRLESTARTALTGDWEGRLSLNYEKVEKGDLYLEIGVDYFFHPQLAVGAEIELGSITDTMSLGLRWYFD